MSETTLPRSSPFQEAREQANNLLRERVVEAAARILVEEGPASLTVRRIAQEIGASTKVLYTLFSDKNSLANALYQAGCDHLEHAVSDLRSSPGDPGAYFEAVADAYLRFALDRPALYGVMFCGTIPGFRPNQASIGTTLAAFDTVLRNVSDLAAAGKTNFAPDGAPKAVKTLWATAHGVLCLHLLGMMDQDEARLLYTRATGAIIASLVPPNSTEPRSTTETHHD